MKAGAKWVSAIENRANFIEHFRGDVDMKVSGQTFQVLIDFMPIQFDLDDEVARAWVEIENNFKEGSIIEVYWIKPVAHWEKSQHTALLVLYIGIAEKANKTLKYSLTICSKLF